MERFHHGHHVRLRSSELGTYLHADEDGHGVSLHHRRASMNAAWAVHLYQPPEEVQYLLLHSAAYGRYLAATAAPAPPGHHGHRVEQRKYDHPKVEVHGTMWLAIPTVSGDEVFLRNYTGGCLRANGRHRPWNNGAATVDEVDFEDTGNLRMNHWVVEPIPPREIVPLLPRPSLLSLLDDILPSRLIVYVWLNADGTVIGVGSFSFSGRSVFRLRRKLARWLAANAANGIVIMDASDLVMCLLTSDGRLFPLVVDLPRSRQPLHIVVVNAAHAALRYADVDAEQSDAPRSRIPVPDSVRVTVSKILALVQRSCFDAEQSDAPRSQIPDPVSGSVTTSETAMLELAYYDVELGP